MCVLLSETDTKYNRIYLAFKYLVVYLFTFLVCCLPYILLFVFSILAYIAYIILLIVFTVFVSILFKSHCNLGRIQWNLFSPG